MTFRKRWFWIACAVIGILAIALTAFVFYSPQPEIKVALPNPNGYDDFTAAAKLLKNVGEGVPSPNDTNFSLARAETYVAKCEPIIELLHTGLSKQTAIPIGFTTNWIDEHDGILKETKRLEMLLALKGYITEQRGDFGAAVKDYTEGLNFGSAIGRGGLIIDTLVSIAEERIALASLTRVVPKLNAMECRAVLRDLNDWRTNRETFELAAERENKWDDVFGRLEIGTVQVMVYKAEEMIKTRSLHPQAQLIVKAEAKYVGVAGIADALRIRLASRAFELEHKSPPQLWSDLVPAYLPEIPIDPQTKRPFARQF
jgi:hypothetical protein